MPRLVDIIYLFESIVAQPTGELVHVGLFTARYMARVARQLFLRRYSLGHSFGICDNKSRFAGRYAAQGLGAENTVGRVGLTVFYVALEA